MYIFLLNLEEMIRQKHLNNLVNVLILLPTSRLVLKISISFVVSTPNLYVDFYFSFSFGKLSSNVALDTEE